MNLVHAVYEPQGPGPHPTVFALHGWGAHALDLLGLAPLLARGQFLVVCPQGPITVPLGPSNGYGWFPLTGGGSLDLGRFDQAVEALRVFLDAAEKRYPIDPQKLVALGFSQGGVMAYALALAAPARFAALAALSSWLPPALVERLPAAARQNLPTLVQHGTGDELIDVARARESVETLRSLGVPLVYREYEMGHEINPRSLGDLVGWLQERVLSPIVRV